MSRTVKQKEAAAHASTLWTILTLSLTVFVGARAQPSNDESRDDGRTGF